MQRHYDIADRRKSFLHNPVLLGEATWGDKFDAYVIGWMPLLGGDENVALQQYLTMVTPESGGKVELEEIVVINTELTKITVSSTLGVSAFLSLINPVFK